MRKILSFLLIVILIFSLSACSENSMSDREEKRVIAVSILPIAGIIKEVCGDDFEIIAVIAEGASPETYDPSPELIKKLQNAEVYFAIGISAEDKILKSFVSEKTKIIKLQEEVSKKYSDLKIGNSRDPHIWLSVKRAVIITEKIAEVLSEINFENSQKYIENSKNYTKKLNLLDKEIKELINSKNGKDFIAVHPAFGYFAEDYSLNMTVLEQDGKSPSPKDLVKLVDFAKKRNIKTVFYQVQDGVFEAESFAEEIGGKAVCLDPLGYDYENNLKDIAIKIAEAI
ncbi:MAG: zinc ABC transporter substrate-binding protein [Clostridia bacterium]|nr:zinc ABC transporter substrate-binding protein [Clostridia bacterium]